MSLNGVEDCVVLVMACSICYGPYAASLVKIVVIIQHWFSCHHFPLPLHVEEQVKSTYKMYPSILLQTGTWSQGTLVEFLFYFASLSQQVSIFLFFSWFAWSTDVKKLSVVTFRPPPPWPEIGWTNVQMTSLANPRATVLFSLTK